MNTLARSDAPGAVIAFPSQPTISQHSAVMALLTLISPSLGVPEANVEVRSAWPEIIVSVHNDPAGFEWWREALDLSPDNADDLDFYEDLGCCSVRLSGHIGSAKVVLIGFLPLPAETTSRDAA